MNRKAIIALIFVMSTALLGLTLIQAYWINWSVKLNGEKLDKNLFEALNDVSDRLRQREISLAMLNYATLINADPGSKKKSIDSINLGDLLIANERIPSPNAEIQPALSTAVIEALFLRLSRQPIAERLDLEALNIYLLQELQNRGIETQYHYGVQAGINNEFIVLDGYYLFEEDAPADYLEKLTNDLQTSIYKVDLFKDADRLESTGQLVLFLPKLKQEIWNSLWGTFAGSFIFTALILFCFIYTISVIFRQKKLSEMKTDFINNMTHEFKTPIATIGLAAESINSEKIIHSPESVRRFIRIIRQENERMLGQVEQVLQTAQLEKEAMKLHLEELNLHDMLKNATEQISVQIDHKHGKLITGFEAERAVIKGDLVHIENIIFNLLDNAIKYSKEKPELELYTRNTNGSIEIEFKDHGIGISKDQKKYIFDKFYRVHTGNLHDVKGFGLGLSYVKAMVEAHQGTIDVQSEPGEGSSFLIKFPLNA
jgi:two-component system phosphate regulon sensor histidine kinase PhoR